MVIRSGRGRDIQVLDAKHLVVGDIIELNAGDIVPADCVLVEGARILYQKPEYQQEYSVSEQESEYIEALQPKTQLTTLLKDTTIISGAGKCVVCCVGNNTQQMLNNEQNDLSERHGTPKMQTKISNFSERYVSYKKKLALLIFIGYFILWLGLNTFADGKEFWNWDSITRFFDNILIGTIMYMMADTKLLKNLTGLILSMQINRINKINLNLTSINALERAGAITELVINKTRVLTFGEMTVQSFFVGI